MTPSPGQIWEWHDNSFGKLTIRIFIILRRHSEQGMTTLSGTNWIGWWVKYLANPSSLNIEGWFSDEDFNRDYLRPFSLQKTRLELIES